MNLPDLQSSILASDVRDGYTVHYDSSPELSGWYTARSPYPLVSGNIRMTLVPLGDGSSFMVTLKPDQQVRVRR